MMFPRRYNRAHSNSRGLSHKVLPLVLIGMLPLDTLGQPDGPAGDAELRAELAALLERDGSQAALQRAQEALGQNPQDAGVRQEYLALHVSLLRTWYPQRKYGACLAAVRAVLAIDPEHEEARAIRDAIHAAQARAETAPAEVRELLRLELFETALERMRELRGVRPDLAETLLTEQRAAWLGGADDNYLARNFNEAFAHYESLLSIRSDAPPDVHSRWALSLALAVAESDFTKPIPADAAARLLARALKGLRHTEEPVIGRILAGLLAERGGQLVEAGRTYADALGVAWTIPPNDRRRLAVEELRRNAIRRLRELYKSTPTHRRTGPWQLTLSDVWKYRRTASFDVHARNDLVAARVAETLEYHAKGIAAWLGETAPTPKTPRCEVRVYGTMAELHQATGTGGVTRAVSHTRSQGGRILSRKIEVFQSDPWLLSSTLPHELTHVLLAQMMPGGKFPLAVDEGLALQTEPPARRLQFRRLLQVGTPNASNILMADRTPRDPLQFYARCDALTDFLLTILAPGAANDARPSAGTAVPRLLETLREGYSSQWWERFGWKSRRRMRADWQKWCATRRDPPRMPLMILNEPSSRKATRGD